MCQAFVSQLSLDALLSNNCKLVFPKLPHVEFWLQTVSLPRIVVNEVKQPTRFIDPNEIGEKLNFSPFNVTFIVDKQMKNWSSIFNWMKEMTVSGSNVGYVDNPVLVIDNKEMINFVGAWPTILGGIDFAATVQEATYVISTLSINYDYINLLQNQTVDSVYK